MKLGRNEPCHCGSGKKYKKCCLRKDEEQQKTQEMIAKNPESEWLSDEEWEDDGTFNNYLEDEYEEEYCDDEDIDEEYEDENETSFPYPKEEVEKYSKKGYDEYPKISSEEEKRVDEWWAKYKKMKSSDIIKQHLEKFLEKNSTDVIINLGLEHEVLFELIADYVKQGKVDEIISFMMQFREKYPEVYVRSAGYYDSDIIAWLISKNRTDEIENFLKYFEQYPINNIDKLFETIGLLIAVNNAKIIVPLIKKIYKAVWFSNEIIRGYEIAETLIAEIYSKYIKETDSPTDFEKLVEELKDMELDFYDDFYDINYWDKRIQSILKDYEKWDEKLPKKKNQIIEKIYNITSNFTRFLNEEKNLTYASANYYSKLMSQYYGSILDSGKKPKSLFLFPKNQIDKTTTDMARDFMSLNSLKAMSILNTLYYFAEYLFKCRNYTEDEKNEVQKSTEELFKILYESTKNTAIETSVFEKFPLFG